MSSVKSEVTVPTEKISWEWIYVLKRETEEASQMASNPCWFDSWK